MLEKIDVNQDPYLTAIVRGESQFAAFYTQFRSQADALIRSGEQFKNRDLLVKSFKSHADLVHVAVALYRTRNDDSQQTGREVSARDTRIGRETQVVHGAPVKPLSPFQFFAKDNQIPMQVKSERSSPGHSKAAVPQSLHATLNQWNSLSLEERQRYIDLSHADNLRYQNQLSQLQQLGFFISESG